MSYGKGLLGYLGLAYPFLPCQAVKKIPGESYSYHGAGDEVALDAVGVQCLFAEYGDVGQVSALVDTELLLGDVRL